MIIMGYNYQMIRVKSAMSFYKRENLSRCLIRSFTRPVKFTDSSRPFFTGGNMFYLLIELLGIF